MVVKVDQVIQVLNQQELLINNHLDQSQHLITQVVLIEYFKVLRWVKITEQELVRKQERRESV